MSEETLFAEFLAWKRAQGAAGPSLTVRELVVKYSPWAEANQKSWSNAGRHCLDNIMAFCGDLPVAEFTHAKADEYVAHRLKQRCKRKPGNQLVKPASINRDLAVMCAAINWGIQRKLVDRNPLEKYKKLPEVHDRDFYINEEEFASLLEHARPIIRQALILAFETGMRRDEVRALEWSEVNKEKAFIKLPANRTKAKRERTIPLSELAMRVIDSCPHYRGARFVFRNPLNDEDRPVPRATFYKWFADARKKAGITGPKGQALWVHTLRHSFCSIQAIEGTIPLRLVMQMVGHASKEVHDRYANMGEDHIKLTKTYLDARRGLETEKPPEPPKPKGPSPLVRFLSPDEK